MALNNVVPCTFSKISFEKSVGILNLIKQIWCEEKDTLVDFSYLFQQDLIIKIVFWFFVFLGAFVPLFPQELHSVEIKYQLKSNLVCNKRAK